MFDSMFDWVWDFLYKIAQWINQLLDGIFRIFLFFSGSAPDSVNIEFTGRPDGNILKLIFDDSTIPFWLVGFTILAGAIFIISLAFGMFRTEFAEDTGKTKAKVLKSAFKGIMTLVLIPALFGIGIMATTTLLSGLVDAMAGSSAEDYSFAQQIFDICMPEYDTTYGTLSWDAPASEVNNFISFEDYNYFIQYFAGILIIVILGITALNVMGRLIDIVLLYIISPVVVAVTPLDEGNRLGIWKDLVISKFLSVAGIIICYYIFFQCMNIVNSILIGNSFIVNLAKLLFAIAGALTANKGSHIITNLVGHNTALLEGQQQGIMASTVTHGAMMGLSGAFKIGKGAWKLGKGSVNAGKKLGGGVGKILGIEKTPQISSDAKAIIGAISGINSSVNTANSIQSRAKGFNAEKNSSQGNTNNTSNNQPLNNLGSNSSQGSQNNANNVMQNGQGFNGKTNGGEGQGNGEMPMPDNSGGMIQQSPQQTMPSADGSIKSAISEGQGFNKGGDNK